MIEFVKTFLFCVDVFFVLYLFGYSTFLFLSVIVGSVDLYQKRRDDELKNNLKRKFFIPISILVPAHNEETTIVDTVCTLLRQDYPLFEIVVIDDGSTDETAQRMIDYFQMRKIERPPSASLQAGNRDLRSEIQQDSADADPERKRRQGGYAEHGHQRIPLSVLYLHGRRFDASKGFVV